MLEMEGEGLRDTETKRDEQRSREGERLQKYDAKSELKESVISLYQVMVDNFLGPVISDIEFGVESYD